MLYRAKQIQGLPVCAADGELGRIEDLYFDVERWGVRYLVVDTAGCLPSGRQVLVSPRAISPESWQGESIRVSLVRQQVEESPPVETTRPIMRYDEIAHAAYYGYPFYWSGPYLWGLGADPASYARARHPPYGGTERAVSYGGGRTDAALAGADRCLLRSCADVVGYGIEASDGAIGRVDDFVIEADTWGIPYLVVDKRAWLPGGKVLVLPDEVDDIDPATRRVRLTITREDVKESPSYS